MNVVRAFSVDVYVLIIVLTPFSHGRRENIDNVLNKLKCPSLINSIYNRYNCVKTKMKMLENVAVCM